VFDDVADGTSFGLTVGLVVTTAFAQWGVGLTIAVIYLAATIYRLVRFVVEKRKQGILGGVTNFAGLPSPAGALMAGTTCVLIPNELINGVVVLATALLMVSRIPYAHFGRTILPHIPKVVRVLGLGAFLFLLALGVRRDEYTTPLIIAFIAAVSYLASPLFWGRTGTPPSD
jgi:CDP-diacylglycerol--serine O-phosphatidyltransferase